MRPLPFRFFTHTQATKAIDSLRNVPAYNEVLKLERLDPGQQRQPTAVGQAGQQMLNICRYEAKKVEGKAPTKDYSSLKKHSTYSNIAVGLQNMQPFKRLDYLKLNGRFEM